MCRPFLFDVIEPQRGYHHYLHTFVMGVSFYFNAIYWMLSKALLTRPRIPISVLMKSVKKTKFNGRVQIHLIYLGLKCLFFQHNGLRWVYISIHKYGCKVQTTTKIIMFFLASVILLPLAAAIHNTHRRRTSEFLLTLN